MLFKAELTEDNVRKVIKFLTRYTVIPSALDGTPVFNLLVHNSDGEKAREICKAINESEDNVTIMSKPFEYDYGEFDIEGEEDYGWFLMAL